MRFKLNCAGNITCKYHKEIEIYFICSAVRETLNNSEDNLCSYMSQNFIISLYNSIEGGSCAQTQQLGKLGISGA